MLIIIEPGYDSAGVHVRDEVWVRWAGTGVRVLVEIIVRRPPS